MRLEREALVILLLIGVVLTPMWYFAIVSGDGAQTVVLDSSQGQIAPNETFLPTPKEVNENVAGVISWLALFGVVAMMYYTHRFIHRMGRTGESAPSEGPAAETDGGRVADGAGAARRDGGPPPGLVDRLPPFLSTAHREVVDAWPERPTNRALTMLGLLTWTTVCFAALLAWEGLHYARTQFLGIYAGMTFLSLGVMVSVYTTWFMPSVTVAEYRSHQEKLTSDEPDQ